MEPAMELRRYVGVLRKRVSVIAVIAALTVCGVVLQLGLRPPQYAAEVSMLVSPQRLTDSSGLNGAPADVSALDAQYRAIIMRNVMYLMNSRTLLKRTADRLGMHAGAVAKSVTVTDVGGTDVLTVRAYDSDPERAALIANTLTQEFTDYYSQINSTEATGARKFIEDQLSRTKDRLSRAESELAAFKSRTGAVALDSQITKMVGRALDLQAAYDTAALDERTARTRAASIQERLRSQRDQLAAVSVATNPVFARLRDNLAQLEFELAGFRQTYTDQHPKVQVQLGKIGEIRKQMNEEAAKALNGQSLAVSPVREQLIHDYVNYQVDAEAAHARTIGMGQILAKVQLGMDGLPANELQLARLQRDVKIQDDTYLRLSALYEDALIRERKAGSSGQAAVIVVDPATVPGYPVSKRLPFMGTLAALLGLMVGAVVALLVESLDDTVRSTNQAEGAFGVPVLAAIPTIDSRSYRHLSGAPAITTVSVPVIVAILLGVGAAALALFLAHQGTGPDQTAFLSRLIEVFQTAR